MNLSPIFKIREEATEELLDLLERVTLGTNGAQYRHLDTRERITEADQPLHLSMERNGKVIGNVTFCRRACGWYIRYFAFDPGMQSGGSKKSGNKSSGILKQELNTFFNAILKGDTLGKTDSFYAYIDPENKKSLWMSETFDFETIGTIATQTFSRIRPKSQKKLIKSTEWSRFEALVGNKYAGYNYYFSEQTSKGPFYHIENNAGEIVAFARISFSTWQIKRLPGKMGGFLTRIIPYVPGLNKLIQPREQTVIVPEAVYARDNKPELLQQLFEGMLHAEKKNLILWWVDERDSLYTETKRHVEWGLLHKIVGVNHASVVRRRDYSKAEPFNPETPVYTSGFDFI